MDRRNCLKMMGLGTIFPAISKADEITSKIKNLNDNDKPVQVKCNPCSGVIKTVNYDSIACSGSLSEQCTTAKHIVDFENDVAEMGSVVSSQDHRVFKKQRYDEKPVGILLNNIASPFDIESNNSLDPTIKASIASTGIVLLHSEDKFRINEDVYSYNGKVTSWTRGTVIGKAVSSSDEDGFVKVKLNV